MRIAIQVSGQQRYGQFFAEFIASLTPFGEIDVFFHHWMDSEARRTSHCW
jgi:hypothetical protein